MTGFSLASIAIPAEFRDVRYDGSRFPGAPGVVGVAGGANCQHYAYALLRHHGFDLPDFRSSELWADRQHTAIVDRMAAFDLVLLHDVADSWGAHVGSAWGRTWCCTCRREMAGRQSKRSSRCSAAMNTAA